MIDDEDLLTLSNVAPPIRNNASGIEMEDLPVRVKRTQTLIVLIVAHALGIIGYLVFLSWSRH